MLTVGRTKCGQATGTKSPLGDKRFFNLLIMLPLVRHAQMIILQDSFINSVKDFSIYFPLGSPSLSSPTSMPRQVQITPISPVPQKSKEPCSNRFTYISSPCSTNRRKNTAVSDLDLPVLLYPLL